MKHKTLFLTLLSSAALAVGCDKNQSASDQMANAKMEAKHAAADMKDYSYAEKGEFVKGMQTQLDALGKDLDQLSAKIESSSDSVKAEARPKLQALRDQQGQLNVQLAKVKDATESTWESVKGGFKSAYQSSVAGFQSARVWVSDKIAP